MQNRNQNGNAIVWILIGVALFAALGYAFSSGSRTSTSILTDEQATSAANQILAYSNEIKSTLKRLVIRGCSEVEISFENTIAGGYDNAAAPADKKCHLFDPAGGGLEFRNQASATLLFTGDIPFHDVGTTEPELSLEISGLNQTTCLKINELLGITDSGNNDFFDSVIPAATKFNGSYDTAGITDIAGDTVASFEGKKSYCRQAGGAYYYMQALIER